MITLSEIKTYLNIQDNSKNEFLINLINQSLQEFEALTNREYSYNVAKIEYIDCNEFSERVYLKLNPVKEITTLQYYDYSNDTYTDLIDGTGDTISNSVLLRHDAIILKKGYSAYGKDLKIIFSGGYKFTKSAGTITKLNGNTSLTGSGTLFLTEAAAGDLIILDSEILQVNTVTTNTALTVTTKTQINHANCIPIFTDFPNDIRQAVKDICKMKYENSNTTYAMVNENMTIKPVNELPYNVNTIIDNYRKVNI